jgi:hypothetical protein
MRGSATLRVRMPVPTFEQTRPDPCHCARSVRDDRHDQARDQPPRGTRSDPCEPFPKLLRRLNRRRLKNSENHRPTPSAPFCPLRSLSMSRSINPNGSFLLTGSLWARSPIRDSEPSIKNAVHAFSDVAGGSDAGAAETSAAWLDDESGNVSALKREITRNIGAKILSFSPPLPGLLADFTVWSNRIPA